MKKDKPYHRISILSKNYWSLDLRSKPVHNGLAALAVDAVVESDGLPLANNLKSLSTFHISLPKPMSPFEERGQIDIPKSPESIRLFKELLLTTTYNGIKYSQQITSGNTEDLTLTEEEWLKSVKKRRSAWARVDKQIMVDILAMLKPTHGHNWWSWDGHEDWYPHVTLANLTASPYDSIKHPQRHVLKTPWYDNDTTNEERCMLQHDYEAIYKSAELYGRDLHA